MSDILFQTEHWVDRQGESYLLSEMTTEHLENTISYLLRTADGIQREHVEVAIASTWHLQGEMAQYYAESEINGMMDSSPEEYVESLPIVEAMREELSRRADGNRVAAA